MLGVLLSCVLFAFCHQIMDAHLALVLDKMSSCLNVFQLQVSDVQTTPICWNFVFYSHLKK